MTARQIHASTLQIKTLGDGTKRFTMLPVVFDRVIYKMRGYYHAIQDYEYWHAPEPTMSPPSGHVLQNIAIAAIIDDNES